MRYLGQRLAFFFATPHPYAARTNRTGAFHLGTVPPGSYVLEAWHPGWETGPDGARGTASPRTVSTPVRVEARETTKVTLDLSAS